MSFVMKYKSEIFGIQDYKEDFIPFDPIEHRIIPIPSKYDGSKYDCVAKVSDKILTLNYLCFDTCPYSNEIPLVLFGKEPSQIIKSSNNKNINTYIFEDLNVEYKYSGIILISNNYIMNTTAYNDPSLPYCFDRLYELTFENGILVKEKDLSDNMYQIRRQYYNYPKSKTYEFYHERYLLMKKHDYSWLHNITKSSKSTLRTYCFTIGQEGDKVLSGTYGGYKTRQKIGLDKKDKDEFNYKFILPDSLMAFTASYFLGCFQESVKTLGVEKFKEKYHFECSNPSIMKHIEMGIKTSNEITLLDRKYINEDDD